GGPHRGGDLPVHRRGPAVGRRRPGGAGAREDRPGGGEHGRAADAREQCRQRRLAQEPFHGGQLAAPVGHGGVESRGTGGARESGRARVSAGAGFGRAGTESPPVTSAATPLAFRTPVTCTT